MCIRDSCRGLLLGDGDNYGKAGYISYVMDYNGLGESIVELCKSKKLRETMGENGYNRVTSLYTKAGFIDEYKKMYKQFEIEKYKEEGRAWQE